MKLHNGKPMGLDVATEACLPKGAAASIIRKCDAFLDSRGLRHGRAGIQFGKGARRIGKTAALVMGLAVVFLSGCAAKQASGPSLDHFALYAFLTQPNADLPASYR